MESKVLGVIKRNIPYIEHLPAYEQAVFQKILHCKTEPVPHLFTRCDHCNTVTPVYASCKNRMCPVCNWSASVKWTAKREQELLPTGYFLLTFTIPAQLRPLFLANRKICYNLLFQAVAQTLLDGMRHNRRECHGKAGFFAVLHTWDQKMCYHPHLHVVIPAGCLSEDGTRWIHAHPSFLLPVKKLSAQFRDTMLERIEMESDKGQLAIPESCTELHTICNTLRQTAWVVNAQPPGKNHDKPEYMIRYLSRYVSKSIIHDSRIRVTGNGKVHIRYYDRKAHKPMVDVITEQQFIARMVTHILPKGFKKVRFFGFMANRYRTSLLAMCRMFLGQPLSNQHVPDSSMVDDLAFLFWKYFRIDITRCPLCGEGHVHQIRSIDTGG